MKKILLGFLMLISLTASAEMVKGTVTDTRKQPIPFATVSVLSTDSTLLTGARTRVTGAGLGTVAATGLRAG